MSNNASSQRAGAPAMIQFAPVFAVVALMFAPGCAATGTSASSAPAAPIEASAIPAAPADESSGLRKGLPAAEVKALLGEPQEVRPYVVQGIESEIWVYKRRFSGGVRQVVARMQEVPYVDPITGVARTIQEPVHEQQTITIVETTELLMFAGVVAEWKQSREAERSFN